MGSFIDIDVIPANIIIMFCGLVNISSNYYIHTENEPHYPIFVINSTEISISYRYVLSIYTIYYLFIIVTCTLSETS